MKRVICCLVLLSAIVGALGAQWYKPSALHNRYRVPTKFAAGGTLVAYWNAGSLALNDGDNVASWGDLTGNGHTATASANYPTYVANCIAGRPCVNFSGSQYLTVTHKADLSITGALSIWAVIVPTAVTANIGQTRVILHKTGAYTFDAAGQKLDFTLNTKHSYSSVMNMFSSATTQGIDQPLLWGSEYTSAGSSNVAHYISSAAYIEKLSFGTNQTIIANTNDMLIGAYTTGTLFWTGKIAALAIYNGVPTQQERETLVQGFCGQFGGPVGLPGCVLPSQLDANQAHAPHAAAALTLVGVDHTIATCPGPSCVLTSDVVHNSTKYVPGGWAGHVFWNVFTAYPGGSSGKEANSVSYSDDGTNWFQPPNTSTMHNICRSATNGRSYADPSLFLENGLMYVFYLDAGGGTEHVGYSFSTDGLDWSYPCTTVLTSTGVITSQLTTPNVVHNVSKDRYEMYTVNRDVKSVQRRVSASLTSGWDVSPVENVRLSTWMPTVWQNPNHVFVTMENGLYYMLLYDATGNPLRFGVSKDGINFQSQMNVLMTGTKQAWCSSLYHSSIVRLVPGQWELFYSCTSPNSRLGRSTITGLPWPL